ncbi:MAG: pyridoxamine 5'-phosphate oxidase family protein, partial [Gammaproteobacteria bacterium]
MSASDKARLNDILDDFDDAMLINHVADGGFQARPMHIAERTAFPHLSFVTAADAAKLDALSRDDRVAVTLQGGGRYVALSGTAVTSADPVRLAA